MDLHVLEMLNALINTSWWTCWRTCTIKQHKYRTDIYI